MPAATALEPGDTLGILGGGQLGRMLAMAAARLGLRCHVFVPESGGPAAQVAAAATIAAYGDRAALDRFAASVDVITLEFENVPVTAVRHLASLKPVFPGARALDVAQDRLSEKQFLNGLDIATAPFAAVDSAADLAAAVREVGRPAILKTRRLGYDGKGQTRIDSGTDLERAWAAASAPSILEGFVSFTRELSVVAARGRDGAVAAYDLAENRHENHILTRTLAPAPGAARLGPRAQAIALAVLKALDYVGVLTVELFETPDGRLLVNEIAPRVHNSGHWTLDACLVSQFEQHVRAVAGWPLGESGRRSDAVMDNLLGDQAAAWADHLRRPGGVLHLYGKTGMEPGRKMGHVTRLFPLGYLDQAAPEMREAEPNYGGQRPRPNRTAPKKTDLC